MHEAIQVEFPSGEVIDSDDNRTNLCVTCHQGRESKVSVDQATEGIEDDTVSEDLGFLNIHYFAAGATRYGTEAKGVFEYDGKEYAGYFDHVEEYSQCVNCHSAHELRVKVDECGDCHEEAVDETGLRDIRVSDADYDGDGDTSEGIWGEIDTMRTALYAAIQDYASSELGAAIVYDSQSYPYVFVDANGNGEVDEDDTDAYNAWTPRLVRAAYNYQYSQKDPGAFAHNAPYITQVLYDTLEDLGADTNDMTRP